METNNEKSVTENFGINESQNTNSFNIETKDVELAVKNDDEINNRYEEEESFAYEMLSNIESENQRFYQLDKDFKELVEILSIIEDEYGMRSQYLNEQYGEGSSGDDEVCEKMRKFLKRTEEKMDNVSELIKESNKAIRVNLAVLGDAFYGVA